MIHRLELRLRDKKIVGECRRETQESDVKIHILVFKRPPREMAAKQPERWVLRPGHRDVDIPQDLGRLVSWETATSGEARKVLQGRLAPVPGATRQCG